VRKKPLPVDVAFRLFCDNQARLIHGAPSRASAYQREPFCRRCLRGMRHQRREAETEELMLRGAQVRCRLESAD
jgi:hypothetical protein